MITVFDYKDYKKYLNEKIADMPSKGRGVKLALSKHLRCQTAYISQILNQHINFSLEQAVKVSDFFGHSKDEAKFFLLLVQMARAGSKELEEFILQEIQEILTKREDFSYRKTAEKNLEELDQHIFYSVWYYSAVHALLSIPKFQTPLKISERLGLPLSRVQEILDFLSRTGLAIKKTDHYEIGQTRIIVPQKSIQLKKHHMNCRNQAMKSIESDKAEDLHYSFVVTHSEKDLKKIKDILSKAIDQCNDVIVESKEERAQILNIDFFKI
ncbi:MAG: hypothetical protein CME62_00235 [Halobacteriovoraceae bacterium]|nr:hypothetical protein [Halobacteriovoraceae bacterium]|tara:strand:- start:15997 stop:16803 length:807 start_codon:yes stop_codon:yes gene_type:complete